MARSDLITACWLLAAALLAGHHHVWALPAASGAAESLRPAVDVQRHHRGAEITRMPGYTGRLCRSAVPPTRPSPSARLTPSLAMLPRPCR